MNVLPLDAAIARAAPDGRYLLFGNGRDALPLMLAGETTPDQPLAAVVPIDGRLPERLGALTRLWRAANHRPVPPDTRLTDQQRRRHRHMLQAVDGRLSGATYRDIAEVIFGSTRLAADAWKTSALRDTTIRLVRDGLAMIEGGYRDLLRHRRR